MHSVKNHNLKLHGNFDAIPVNAIVLKLLEKPFTMFEQIKCYCSLAEDCMALNSIENDNWKSKLVAYV